METTLISPLAVRELLLNSGWTYHPEHKVFTQFLDLELSPKFWDSARTLPSDDCNFDRLARHMGIPRDTLIEDLEQRTQRLQDEKLDPQKAPRINSEKIIFFESNPAAEEKESAPDEIESEAAAVPRLLGETLAASIRAGLCYAQECRHDADTQHGPNPWAEQIDCDIRMMRCALKMLGFKA
jgi:hypothetical protein